MCQHGTCEVVPIRLYVVNACCGDQTQDSPSDTRNPLTTPALRLPPVHLLLLLLLLVVVQLVESVLRRLR